MKKTNLFLLVACSTIILPTLSQQKNNDMFYKYLYDKAEALFNGAATDSTDSLALTYYTKTAAGLQKEHSNARLLYNCYERSGILKQGLNYPADSVLRDYYKALAIQKDYSLSDSILFRLLLSAGNVHYTKALFDSSVYYFSKAEKIIGAYPSAGLAGDLYNSLGALYSEAGNYEQSGIYFSKALELTKQNHPELNEAIFAMSANIASAVRLSGYDDSALVLYKQLLNATKPFPAIINNISAIYIAEKKPDSALHYLQLGNSRSGSYSISNYNALAQAYMLKGNAAMALQQLQHAAALYHPEEGIKNNAYGATQKYWGDLLMFAHQPAQALPHYQRALIQFDDKFNDSNIYRNPGNFVGDFASYNLFEALTAKAFCLATIYTDNNKEDDFKATLTTYDSAFTLADYIRKSIDNDQARLFISDKVFVAYKQAVDFISNTKEGTEEENIIHALKWISKSRATSLAISLKENTIQQYAGIPDSLLQQEKNLKISISRMKLQLRQATDSGVQKKIQSDINTSSLSLQTLYNSFRNYPAYYRQKFASDSISISSIQSKILDDETAVLCYFKGATKLYTFIIRHDAIMRYVSEADSAYENNLNVFVNQLAHFDAGESYHRSAGIFLYDKLVKPIRTSLTGIGSLIIIPDESLINLPFEALETGDNQYLVTDFSVTYQYALPFLQMETKKMNRNQSIAFAPFASPNPESDFSLLPSSMTEISVFDKSVQFINSDATKEKFISAAGKSSVIHLATHAAANYQEPEQSYIAFYEGNRADSSYKLFAHELYNLSLPNTQLVFLSACETGSGKMSRSEGALSLSRAFSFAGCPNVITSLWKAEDKSTAYISTHFYGYLEKGYSYAQALQSAKVDLLADKNMFQFRSPVYWSHLIFIGTVQTRLKDSNSFGFVKNPSFLAAFLMVLIAIGAGLFYFIKKGRVK